MAILHGCHSKWSPSWCQTPTTIPANMGRLTRPTAARRTLSTYFMGLGHPPFLYHLRWNLLCPLGARDTGLTIRPKARLPCQERSF